MIRNSRWTDKTLFVEVCGEGDTFTQAIQTAIATIKWFITDLANGDDVALDPHALPAEKIRLTGTLIEVTPNKVAFFGESLLLTVECSAKVVFAYS